MCFSFLLFSPFQLVGAGVYVMNDSLVFWGAPLRANETEITLDIRLSLSTRKVKKSCEIVKPNCVPQ
jgi:hypothetical protein